jgi:hypothetical protein
MSARLRRFVAVVAVAVTALAVAPAAAFGHKPRGTGAPRPTSPVPGLVLARGCYTSIQVPGASGDTALIPAFTPPSSQTTARRRRQPPRSEAKSADRQTVQELRPTRASRR